MTIEALLERNNSLLEQLIAKFDHIGAAPSAPAASNAAQRPAPSAKPASSPPAKSSAPAAAAGSKALTYDKDVKPVTLQLINKGAAGRDKVVEILKEFGVTKATELKPEQFADFIAKVKAAL